MERVVATFKDLSLPKQGKIATTKTGPEERYRRRGDAAAIETPGAHSRACQVCVCVCVCAVLEQQAQAKQWRANGGVVANGGDVLPQVLEAVKQARVCVCVCVC